MYWELHLDIIDISSPLREPKILLQENPIRWNRFLSLLYSKDMEYDDCISEEQGEEIKDSKRKGCTKDIDVGNQPEIEYR